jgi:transposase
VKQTLLIKKTFIYKEQNIQKRQDFKRELLKLSPHRLVYIDEAGLADNDPISRGYAPKGQRCYAQKSGRAKKRVSFIAGLMQNKIIAPMTFEGSCDRFVFEAWLKQVLIPELPTGSVLIMDNASFHKGGNISKIVAMAGCSILYLAPYSPEDNPIEHYWPRIKNKARQNAEYYYNFRDAVDHALMTT